MIVVIPCGGKKRRLKSPAYALYTGSYFKAALGYALSIAKRDRVFILSAKHGLLRLTDEIAPYDQFMGDPGAVASATVAAQAKALGIDREQALIIGGKHYHAAAKGAFASTAWFTDTLPDGQTGMGYQIAAMVRGKHRLPRGLKWSAAGGNGSTEGQT